MARKLLNAKILSVRDFENGVSGILGEVFQLTKSDGSQVFGNFDQPLATFDLADKKTGEVQKYWMDGGLKGAFSLTKVKPGTHVEIIHTGETTMDLDDGKKGRVQTYELYGLE